MKKKELFNFLLGTFFGLILASILNSFLGSSDNEKTAYYGSLIDIHLGKRQNFKYSEAYATGNRSLLYNRLADRAKIPQFLNDLGLLGEAVEVGVRDGEFSSWILSHWKGKRLHLVDPWLHQKSEVYNDVSNVCTLFFFFILFSYIS
jgi:hypothetical protein